MKKATGPKITSRAGNHGQETSNTRPPERFPSGSTRHRQPSRSYKAIDTTQLAPHGLVYRCDTKHMDKAHALQHTCHFIPALHELRPLTQFVKLRFDRFPTSPGFTLCALLCLLRGDGSPTRPREHICNMYIPVLAT